MVANVQQIARMSKVLLEEILRLPVGERIQLVEEIWNSIAATPQTVPLPEAHRAELDYRLDHPSSGPAQSWEEVRARLRKKG